ncbi:MAG: hypothetical protein LBM13_01850 [Candidatus Ancillula sp.]|jgi:hypothetical protein|nr:hypothetical protein [Candidatus Ancillula sp.]
MDQFSIAEVTGLISIVVSLVGFGSVFGVINTRIGGLEKRMDRLEPIVDRLSEDVSWLKGSMVSHGNSPIKLTQSGEKIFIDLEGKKFVDSKFDKLNKFVVDSGAANEYTVQEQSISAIGETATSEEINKFQSYAFKNGWKVEQIYEALGLYLRDEILTRRIANG